MNIETFPQSTEPPLVITTHDARRLEALIDGPQGARSPMARPLENEIARARIVEPAQVPPDVVTMNSKILCIDDACGERHELQLVYPQDADAQSGRVSVLAPVGAALLGLAVGRSIDWPLPGGRTARLRVERVTYQPEAAGRLD